MVARRRPGMSRIDGAQPDSTAAAPATVTPITRDRGRDALIRQAPAAPAPASAADVVADVPVRLIDPAPDNPRSSLGDVSGLAASIEERGLLSPVLVLPRGDRYELVYGHRRLAAVQLLKRSTIRAIVTTDSDPASLLAKRIVENVQREDLSPLDEARAFQDLLELKVAGGQRGVAKMVSKSQGYVSQRLDLLRLPADVQAKVGADSGIRISDANELAKLAKVTSGPGAVAKVLRAQQRGVDLAQAVRQELRDIEDKTARDAEVAKLRAAGVTILKGHHRMDYDTGPCELRFLGGAAKDHWKQSCHAIAVPTHGRSVMEVCVDPGRHRAEAAASASKVSSEQSAERKRQEAEEQRRAAERATRIAAAEAAAAARRQFGIRLVGKGAPDLGAGVLTAELMWRQGEWMCIDVPVVAELLGLPVDQSEDESGNDAVSNAVARYAAKSTRNAQRAVYAVGLALGEASLAEHRGRAYLKHLVSCGYQLSAAEAEWLKAGDEEHSRDDGEWGVEGDGGMDQGGQGDDGPAIDSADRARCPVCRGDVAVRRTGEIREHPDHRHSMYGVPGAVRDGLVPVCAGSGELPQ
jgi:ParB family chromosome partitioning protein